MLTPEKIPTTGQNVLDSLPVVSSARIFRTLEQKADEKGLDNSHRNDPLMRLLTGLSILISTPAFFTFPSSTRAGMRALDRIPQRNSPDDIPDTSRLYGEQIGEILTTTAIDIGVLATTVLGTLHYGFSQHFNLLQYGGAFACAQIIGNFFSLESQSIYKGAKQTFRRK